MPITLYSVSVQHNQYERISVVSGPHPPGALVLLHTALDSTPQAGIYCGTTHSLTFHWPTHFLSANSFLKIASAMGERQMLPKHTKSTECDAMMKGTDSEFENGTVERTRAAQCKFGARRKLTASVHGRRVNTNRFQAIPISVIILFLPPSSYPSNIPSSTPATFLLSLALLVLLCDPTCPPL